jgi:hypothetical protein
MDKHFTLSNINFTQRQSDGYVDVTQLCQNKKKLFANWFRTKKAKKFLDDFDTPLIKTNRHSWMKSECIKPLLDWLITSEYDFDNIQKELQKPFDNIIEIEEKTPENKNCSKCKEELAIEQFDKNKNMKDGYDIRCKNCYKEYRASKSDYVKDRALKYYYENKEQCAKTKSNWQKENKEKVNTANRKSYAKKQKVKEEQKVKDDEEKRILEEEKVIEEIKEDEKNAQQISDTVSNMGQIILINKLNEPYTVVCRESDGYINVTNLCKAGGKMFHAWRRLAKTKKIIQLLTNKIESECHNSLEKGFLSPELIYTGTGVKNIKNSVNETWVHPKIAINIAQWISPEFDIQVTDWIHQLLVFGHVRLTDKVTDKEVIDIQVSKQKHNRLIFEGKEDEADTIKMEYELKIKELENKNIELVRENLRISKYLERKRRVQYNKEKVIYILKNEEFENKKLYKVGTTNYLTSRMSTYNTGSPKDYDVIYHKYTMNNSMIELMIKQKFVNNLCSLNKEWYEFDEGPGELIKNIENGVVFFEDK